MPRFYFDVREDGAFFSDEEGMELPDLAAAEIEAAQSAASIGRDLLPKGTTRAITVEVRNENKQRVLTSTVTLHTVRVDPQPE